MSTPTGPDSKSGRSDRPHPDQDADADELADDIAQTREDLSDTINALSERLDVKAQAKQTAHDATQRAQEQSRDTLARLSAIAGRARSALTDHRGKPKPWALAGAALLLISGVLSSVATAIRRRRRRKPEVASRRGARK